MKIKISLFFIPHHGRIQKRNSLLEVFLGKGVRKICSKFTEHPCQGVISMKIQSNFIEITLQHECYLLYCSIFSEQLFKKTRMEGCFCQIIIHIRPLFPLILMPGDILIQNEILQHNKKRGGVLWSGIGQFHSSKNLLALKI